MRSKDRVKDLGFMFSCNLDPDPHIEYVCCKAFKTLGFILRLCNECESQLGLSFVLSIKVLYCDMIPPYQ